MIAADHGDDDKHVGHEDAGPSQQQAEDSDKIEGTTTQAELPGPSEPALSSSQVRLCKSTLNDSSMFLCVPGATLVCQIMFVRFDNARYMPAHSHCL